MRREQLGTTGIGRHIAIPHSRHPAVDRLIGTMALSRDGLPFDSLDGEPVYVFVLLVSPQDRPGDHLRALEAVVRTMRNDEFVRQLRACQTRDEIWAHLENAAPGW
jgi:PTS system fructose-specific IIA component/PTS system nitrogen regulatory IIA component